MGTKHKWRNHDWRPRGTAWAKLGHSTGIVFETKNILGEYSMEYSQYILMENLLRNL